MAFNWQTFWTRAFTALIFVAVMMAGMLYNEWSFFILIVIIHFGCWYEYGKLIGKIHSTYIHPYIVWGFALIGFHVVLLFSNGFMLNYYSVKDSFSLSFLLAGAVLVLMGIFKKYKVGSMAIATLAAGILYISLSLGLLFHLRLSEDIPVLTSGELLFKQGNGFYIPLLIIVAIWINDTMAYLVGSAIGKTPFSKISPKKTIEGTAGGMILCVLALVFILKPWFHWQVLLGISVLVAVFGTLGDLLESKIKRMAGVKDSGKIMPGHGGFLDRFDSLLIAVPAVWVFLQILK
ncbi:MAG: phosphatidate cytidylyltransferase [Niabella sp.]